MARRFEHNAELVENLGFDDTFRRMWRFYLAYSEAGFRSGYLDVGQLVLAPPERAPSARGGITHGGLWGPLICCAP